MEMSVVQYGELVGKYIRMERQATAEEQDAGDPPTIGMECLVDKVEHGDNGQVTICADYGYAFTIEPGTADKWTFTVWPDEATALRSYTVPDSAAEWIAKALADPDAPNGTITFRSARAVFELVRRFDATGVSGWE